MLFAARADDAAQRLNPLAERRLQRAHRPIASEHDAVGAERVERVIDDRREGNQLLTDTG